MLRYKACRNSPWIRRAASCSTNLLVYRNTPRPRPKKRTATIATCKVKIGGLVDAMDISQELAANKPTAINSEVPLRTEARSSFFQNGEMILKILVFIIFIPSPYDRNPRLNQRLIKIVIDEKLLKPFAHFELKF